MIFVLNELNEFRRWDTNLTYLNPLPLSTNAVCCLHFNVTMIRNFQARVHQNAKRRDLPFLWIHTIESSSSFTGTDCNELTTNAHNNMANWFHLFIKETHHLITQPSR